MNNKKVTITSPHIDPSIIGMLPKTFIDSVAIVHSKEMFYIVIASGEQLFCFCAAPSFFKKIKETIDKNYKSYQEKNGDIQSQQELIVSPFTPGESDGEVPQT